MKSFLKWAGGKSRMASQLKKLLEEGDRLVEPFVGSGALFLSSDFENYLLCDTNLDLINLYDNLKNRTEELLKITEKLFLPGNNSAVRYYEFRDKFNLLDPRDIEKSALFVYLNKHAFNGLCRYNKSGAFNVPFGKYRETNFPLKDMLNFSQKAEKAEFRCQDFEETFKSLKVGDVIYCDPPYVPLSNTSSFTSYSKSPFNMEDHWRLAEQALQARERGFRCVISNHDLSITREMYKDSEIHELTVQRNIGSSSKSRKKVAEIVAIF